MMKTMDSISSKYQLYTNHIICYTPVRKVYSIAFMLHASCSFLCGSLFWPLESHPKTTSETRWFSTKVGDVCPHVHADGSEIRGENPPGMVLKPYEYWDFYYINWSAGSSEPSTVSKVILNMSYHETSKSSPGIWLVGGFNPLEKY